MSWQCLKYYFVFYGQNTALIEIILNIVKVTVALKQCYVDNLIRRPEVIQYKTTRFKMRQDYSGMKLRFCASIFSG